MTRRRRLAVLVAGLIAASGVVALPLAEATEPSVKVPARQWGCVWVDLVGTAVCVSG